MPNDEIGKLLLTSYEYSSPMDVLRIIAQGLLAEGVERAEVVACFELARLLLSDEERDEKEDVLLEVLDALHGWGPLNARF